MHLCNPFSNLCPLAEEVNCTVRPPVAYQLRSILALYWPDYSIKAAPGKRVSTISLRDAYTTNDPRLASGWTGPNCIDPLHSRDTAKGSMQKLNQVLSG